MQYHSKQNLREIGRVLGVSHVLEGTVRRSEGKVHMNVQFVDAHTDTHVWAEEYDRNLNEVFAIGMRSGAINRKSASSQGFNS